MTKLEEFKEKIDNDTVEGRDLILCLEAIQEISESNSDILDLLNDLKEEGSNIYINILVDEIPAALIVEDGLLRIQEELVDEPTVTVRLSEDTAKEILRRQTNMQKAFTDKKVQLEGELTKAAALLLLINICGDELGIS
jgi:alkyl sulfatase BDS1-like metallo-beta-lactamase superfamily hydrolase